MYCFKDIIDEIENRITEDIDIAVLAQKANVSVYEFRRIFTFVTGVSFGEYVRKRRLSMAALELHEGGKSVTELSVKYGYDSPSSFSRAFKDYHNVSPSEIVDGNMSFKIFTKINAEIVATGGKDIVYSISDKPDFTVSGFCGKSDLTDSECCENVWSAFYDSEISENVVSKSDKIYAVYDNGEDCVKCLIGAIGEKYGESIAVPASRWACFKLVGTEDGYVNEFYKDILIQWLASSGYEKNKAVPNIEVFPADMEQDGFEWEIHIPIIKA